MPAARKLSNHLAFLEVLNANSARAVCPWAEALRDAHGPFLGHGDEKFGFFRRFAGFFRGLKSLNELSFLNKVTILHSIRRQTPLDFRNIQTCNLFASFFMVVERVWHARVVAIRDKEKVRKPGDCSFGG
jgi:hypothetical protein